MPRAKVSKTIKVVGPTLMIGDKKVVEYDTKFVADGANGLDWADLSVVALDLHHTFLNRVNAKLTDVNRPTDMEETE